MIERTSRNAQRGAVLIVALLFLTILTVLGVTAMTATTYEEKMAGHARDSNLAFQAAEAALRDARRDIHGIVIGAFNAPRKPAISKATGFGDGTGLANGSCAPPDMTEPQRIGLCFPKAYDAASGVPPPFNDTVSLINPPSVQYGTFTGATMPLTLLSRLPRYFIEVLCYPPPIDTIGASGAEYCNFFRITGVGWGANINTQVVVQEIFLRP